MRTLKHIVTNRLSYNIYTYRKVKVSYMYIKTVE